MKLAINGAIFRTKVGNNQIPFTVLIQAHVLGAFYEHIHVTGAWMPKG
jgi:hypothetical protein